MYFTGHLSNVCALFLIVSSVGAFSCYNIRIRFISKMIVALVLNSDTDSFKNKTKLQVKNINYLKNAKLFFKQ